MMRPSIFRCKGFLQMLGLVGLALLVIVAGNLYFINEHLDWVNAASEERGRLLVVEVRRDLKDMQRLAEDWSTWQELTAAVAQSDLKYLNEKVYPSQLASLNADFCAMYQNGRPVALVVASEVVLTEDVRSGLAGLFTPQGAFRLEQAGGQPLDGFARVGHTHILFSSKPLLNGGGRVLFGKLVNAPYMLGNADENNLHIIKIEERAWNEVPETVRLAFMGKDSRLDYLEEKSSDLSGYLIMRTINADPVVFYINQGSAGSMAGNMAAVVLAGLLVLVLLAFAAYKAVVAVVLTKLGFADRIGTAEELDNWEKMVVQVENTMLCVKDLEQQVEEMNMIIVPGRELDEERSRLQSWHNDFLALLQNNKKAIDNRRYLDPQSSRFGRWLFGRGQEFWGKYKIFAEIQAEYREMSLLMSEIALLHNAQKDLVVWEEVSKLKQLAQSIDRKMYRLSLIRNEVNWQIAQKARDVAVLVLRFFIKARQTLDSAKL
ncbi:MAG: hypothetical protein N3A57_01530 [Negativicutes bacterium]|nr:hypothetical protein [Negativicutes bacterium]